jgi:hypothetical protein
MDADEREICNFLKTFPGEFVSAKDIARRAAGKWRFREDPEWATPVLARLVERHVIEGDSRNYYRLLPSSTQTRKKQWVAPHIKQLLEKSGKRFDIDEEDASAP